MIIISVSKSGTDKISLYAGSTMTVQDSIKAEMFITVTIFVFLQNYSVVRASKAQLSVYDNVPGLQESPFYDIRVRRRHDEQWLDPFTFVTECTGDKFCNTTGEKCADCKKQSIVN